MYKNDRSNKEGNAGKNTSGRKEHMINMGKSKERKSLHLREKKKKKGEHQEGINKIN